MSDNETIFEYNGKELVKTGKPEEKLLIADSWLVSEGRVRALQLHRERFFSSCQKMARIEQNILDDFWNQSMGTLAKTGSWFPRIELAGNLHQPVFQFRIRKAPPTHPNIKLIDYQSRDFRKMPRHKGPDLAKLISARKNIVEQGADEAILTTPKGFLLEGLTTSILWWEGSTLCTTPASWRVLPGVTGQLIRTIAEKNDIPVASRSRKLKELNGCEVWAVNALHGIRRAVNWEHAPFTTTRRVDLEKWRQELDLFMENL